jgi:membrane associated rhomboid family serine protease
VAVRRAGSPLSFGGRIPPVVGGLVVATVVVSIAAAVGGRSGVPLWRLLGLDAGAVWRGQVWRLATWVLLENQPLNLLFGGLVLWMFGRDLVDVWGPRRFLAAYFGVPAAAAAVACVVALAWPAVAAGSQGGFWVALNALVIAWALLHPFRQILLFFAVPVSGQALVWITVGGTVLFALFDGPAAFVPHLLAQGIAWLWVSGNGPGRWLRRIRLPRMRRRGRFEVIHVDRDPDRKAPDRRWLN